ncbi:MAG: PIN domain-containing protein [Acidimicrobiia bacterium]
MRRYLTAALDEGHNVAVPAVVVAETVRGGPRDAPVNRLLNRVVIDPADESTARRAGELLAMTESDATIDALVVAAAERRSPSVVVSRDPDIARLAGQALLVRVDAR